MRAVGTQYIDSLVTIDIDRAIKDFVTLDTRMIYDMSKLTDGIKSQTRTNLRRGWCSALSGQAFMLYQLIASAFDIPVICIGRAENCIISYKADNDALGRKLVSDLLTMMRLADPDCRYDKHNWGYYCRSIAGHSDDWLQLVASRPRILDINGICNMLGVDSPFDYVPKDNCLRAMAALEAGNKLEITRCVRS